jgi:hypothetical protein
MSSKINIRSIPITFILSRGRSGSTLIQSVLDAHPNICAPIEAKFVLHLKSKYEHLTDWNEDLINMFIKDLYTNRKFRLFWNVTKDELTAKFDNYEINHFRDACKVVYLCHHSMFRKEGIKLIVDKNPLHSRFSDSLLSIFPNAKFIHLIRDPRAVTSSHIKSLKQKSPTNLAYEWRLLNEKVEIVKRSNPQLFHTLKYEGFTANPDLEARKLFDFLDLPFDPEILNASITIKEKYLSNTYLSLPHHKNISTPINTSKNDAWKKNLTSDEVNLINTICQDQLISYSYRFNPTISSFTIQLKIFKGRWKSKLKNRLLQFMFALPFSVRALVYNTVSLIKDKKYTH